MTRAPETTTMDAEVERLALKIVDDYRKLDPGHRVLIAVAGRPGSGKSTLAYPLSDRVNELILGHPVPRAPIDTENAIAAPARPSEEGDDVSICVGLDGWHHTRAELDAFPDPELAHWRRGAAFTFNCEAYTDFVTALRTVPAPAEIAFPTFDHKLKDPRPSPHPVLPRHRIVIVEGLYTMLDTAGWRACAAQMDERVWVEVPRAICFARVMRRNVEAGIVSKEMAEKRVNASDMVNGDDVANGKYHATETIYPADRPE